MSPVFDPEAEAAARARVGLRVGESTWRQLLPDETQPGAAEASMSFDGRGRPGPHSTKVGWTVRRDGKIRDAFDFRINPQGLAYTLGSRATLAATKGGLYVDDFGPGASVVVLRQLVASGADRQGPYSYTARESVQQFLKDIYLPATTGRDKKKMTVFFHDHHFERGFEQRVFFPPGSLTIERSTELHGLWRVELQMISLEKYPYAEVEVDRTPDAGVKVKRYVVRRGDTLERLVRKVAGRHASAGRRKQVRTLILSLNPKLKKKRNVPNQAAPGKPMKVYPGEVLALPA